jgi:hypothetical protein
MLKFRGGLKVALAIAEPAEESAGSVGITFDIQSISTIVNHFFYEAD